MKKKKEYKTDSIKSSKAEEPLEEYGIQPHFRSVKDFTFGDFKKIAAKVDFTQNDPKF